jgi:hypothetical protein
MDEFAETFAETVALLEDLELLVDSGRVMVETDEGLPPRFRPIERLERGADDHDCADWNCGGACLICHAMIPGDVQLRVEGINPRPRRDGVIDPRD